MLKWDRCGGMCTSLTKCKTCFWSHSISILAHADSVLSFAYLPGGQHIVSGSCDHTIQMWDVNTGAAVFEPLRGHINFVIYVVYSPGDQHIISGSDDHTIWVQDTKTGATESEPLRDHTDSICFLFTQWLAYCLYLS